MLKNFYHVVQEEPALDLVAYSNFFDQIKKAFQPIRFKKSTHIAVNKLYNMSNKECRNLGYSDHPHISKRGSRDKLLQEVYRECLVDVQEQANGKSKHQMQYCIPALNFKLGRIHRPEVCLPT